MNKTISNIKLHYIFDNYLFNSLKIIEFEIKHSELQPIL